MHNYSAPIQQNFFLRTEKGNFTIEKVKILCSKKKKERKFCALKMHDYLVPRKYIPGTQNRPTRILHSDNGNSALNNGNSVHV